VFCFGSGQFMVRMAELHRPLIISEYSHMITAGELNNIRKNSARYFINKVVSVPYIPTSLTKFCWHWVTSMMPSTKLQVSFFKSSVWPDRESNLVYQLSWHML